jgi:hypothetical protein
LRDNVDIEVKDKNGQEADKAKKERSYAYQSASKCINFSDFKLAQSSFLELGKDGNFAGGNIQDEAGQKVTGLVNNGAGKKDEGQEAERKIIA